MPGQTFFQYRGKIYGWSNLYLVPREGLRLIKPLFSTERRFMAGQTSIQYREKVYGCQTSFQYRGKVYVWSNFYSVPREGLWLVKPLFNTKGRFMVGQTFIQYRG